MQDGVGLFGQIRNNRSKSRQKRREKYDARDQKRLYAYQTSHPQVQQQTSNEMQGYDDLQNTVNQYATAEEKREQEARERYKEDSLKDVMTDVPGLTPQARQAMQESANKQIGGQLQNYRRMIASSEGERGVRGSKAQAGLNREALDAQAQVQRDLNVQDSDRAMQRLAAYLSGVEGRSSQDVLRRQKIQDYMLSERNRKKQDQYVDYFKNYFNKL